MFRLVLLLLVAVTTLIVYDSTHTNHVMNDHPLIEKERYSQLKTIQSSFFPKDIRIVTLGDSLTSGYGDQSGNGGYVPVLKSMLSDQRSIENVDVKNYGIGGIYSTQLIDVLNKSYVQESIKNADYVIITIGGNDVIKAAQEHFLQLTTEAFEEENKEFTRKVNIMIHKIKFYNPNAKIFFVGIYNPFASLFSSYVPEIDQIIATWNEGTEQELSKYGNTYFIPLFDIFRGKEKEFLYDDFIHPNERGYKNIAFRVLTYLDHYDESTTYVVGEYEE
ncbi:GDSL-type esterase/lipase family protein [Bacillus suaedaesalsae]|uniref:GDSL family lipase n=1 Tax=Bacillus suaedaesalsae TaxID=2810349 RepID=A0ABS2DLI8_9BACI|nr:GDSL-type esterase/lipase family protein [Bacillus suaedaesalsae]MBM6619359.1 GDSL family lipase [Bacillus suaedaesalsae]